MQNNQNTKIAPDGGWGWIVVASVCLINVFNQSIMSVFSLLFGDLLKSMNEETAGAALVTNLNCLALNFSGLFIGPAIKNFSPRKVAFTGCLLTSCGLMLCSLSTKLWHVIFGYSFLFGIGLGLIAPSGFMAINSYFTTRRGRAVGIALAGTGVGQMIIPHVVRILLEHYGFRTTMLVMGALALNGLIGALTFRPLQPIAKHNNMKEIKLLLDLKNGKQDFEIKVVKNNEIKEVDQLRKKSKANNICKKVFKTLVKAMDLELLEDPVFWSIIIGLGLVYTATQNFSMLFPYFLQDSVGFSRSDTALCMSVLAGFDLISRILLPFLTDRLGISYRVVFFAGTIGLLISRAFIAESDQLINIIIASAFYGIMKSATVVNNNLTITEYCKPEKLAGGLGLQMIIKGILVISIGQLLGWLRDFSGSFILCMHSQNILLAIVVVFWLPELIYKYVKVYKCKQSINSIDGSSENLK